MISFAAGMAREGYFPYVHTFAVFICRRPFDQVAMSIAYPNLPVRMIGSGEIRHPALSVKTMSEAGQGLPGVLEDTLHLLDGGQLAGAPLLSIETDNQFRVYAHNLFVTAGDVAETEIRPHLPEPVGGGGGAMAAYEASKHRVRVTMVLKGRPQRCGATIMAPGAIAGIDEAGLGPILGPLVVWLIKKDEMPYVDEQFKKVMNFQISWTIWAGPLGRPPANVNAATPSCWVR